MTKLVNRVSYEWDLETFDIETNDVIDHHWFDRCPGIPSDEGVNLVLIRDVYRGLSGDDFNDTADLHNRSWAYVEGGKLPKEFDGGARVPKRFHDELKKRGHND